MAIRLRGGSACGRRAKGRHAGDRGVDDNRECARARARAWRHGQVAATAGRRGEGPRSTVGWQPRATRLTCTRGAWPARTRTLRARRAAHRRALSPPPRPRPPHPSFDQLTCTRRTACGSGPPVGPAQLTLPLGYLDELHEQFASSCVTCRLLALGLYFTPFT